VTNSILVYLWKSVNKIGDEDSVRIFRHDVFLRLFVNRFTLDVFTKRFLNILSLVPITFYPSRPQHNDHMTTSMFYNVK